MLTALTSAVDIRSIGYLLLKKNGNQEKETQMNIHTISMGSSPYKECVNQENERVGFVLHGFFYKSVQTFKKLLLSRCYLEHTLKKSAK